MCLYLKRNRFYSFCFVIILFIIVHNGMAQNPWFTQNSGTSEDLRAISVVNADTAYVVGFNGTILKTTDGGTVWQPLTSGTTEPLFSVFFIDDTTGWVAGNNIYKTNNGGENWMLDYSTKTGPIGAKDMCFINENCGWLINWDGQIYKYKNK